MKKTFILFVIVISLMILCSNVGADEPPVGYRKLIDYQIFDDSVQGWSGSGNDELETVNANLPVDTTETYNGKSSLRLNVTETLSEGWWMSLITVRDWNIHDFSQYVENGFLEFNIKGEEGGESFIIGLRDKVYEREAGLEIDVLENINDYINITTEWEHVKIPLSDLMDSSNEFDPKNVMCLVLNNSHSQPFTVWLNDIKITSPDNEKAASAIKINQLGFVPEQQKHALITGFPEELAVSENTTFEIKDADDNKTVYTGSLILSSEFEPVDSGEKIYKALFNDLNKPGEYYLSLPGTDIDDSPVFMVAEDVYDSLLVDSARYFYYQRQGIDLEADYASEYPRADLTPQDANAVFASGKSGTLDVTKGWYDAGDFGKYVNAGATAVSDLFWAYEMFPDIFTDEQFNIPESGNNIPDLLDEARWELEWMLKMQDQSSGGFYPRVQSDDDKDITERIVKDQNGTTTDDTACAAAVLAHAYIIYKDIDSAFANQCLIAAEDGWTFLESNPDNIISPSGPYNISDDSADRLWAAASLFRATGYEKYHDYFKQHYQIIFDNKFEDEYAYANGWGDMWLAANFMYLKAENNNPEAVEWIEREFDIWLDTIYKRYNENPWNNAIVSGNYFWGINMQLLNVPMAVYIFNHIMEKDTSSAEEMIYDSLNWILGTNPLRLSFVSGYGEDSAEKIFSNIYNNDGKDGIPAGYMPGGPNTFEGEGLSNFAAKCYIHSSGDWVTNEHTVYWNSALVFNAAMATSKSGNNQDLETGDINGDGVIDSIDFSYLRKYLLNRIDALPNDDLLADMNEDDSIDSLDIAALRKYLLNPNQS